MSSMPQLSVTLLRSSKSHSFHSRHLIPPESPCTQAEFTQLFMLWYQFVANRADVPQLTGMNGENI